MISNPQTFGLVLFSNHLNPPQFMSTQFNTSQSISTHLNQSQPISTYLTSGEEADWGCGYLQSPYLGRIKVITVIIILIVITIIIFVIMTMWIITISIMRWSRFCGNQRPSIFKEYSLDLVNLSSKRGGREPKIWNFIKSFWISITTIISIILCLTFHIIDAIKVKVNIIPQNICFF